MADEDYFEIYEDEWISASEAVRVVAEHRGGAHQAKLILADSIRSMTIDVCAETVWQTSEPDVGGDWVPDKELGLLHAESVWVDPDVWIKSEGWPDDLANWRWERNEFVLFLAPRDSDDPLNMFFKGVTLRRDHVLRAAGLSKRTGKGGRRADMVAWNAFWHAVVKLAISGELTAFRTQADLTAAILEDIGDALSARTISQPVSEVWKKHIEG